MTKRDSAFLCASASIMVLVGSAVAIGAAGPEPCGSDLAERDAAVRATVEAKGRKFAERGPKRADQPGEAMAFFLEQRLAPGMRAYPAAHMREMLDEVMARESRSIGRDVGGIAAWTELGPGNIGGRTRTIVIDPTNPDVMYAGGVAGGVWTTTDGGASWAALDDLMVNLAVTTIAMDPADPSVLYAGTGEGFFNGDGVRGLGVFKSVDSGATWSQLASTANAGFHYVNQLVISATDSDRVYAGTRHGVHRSEDGGATWTLVLANPAYASGLNNTQKSTSAGCLDLAIRTDTDPDVLFAAFGTFTKDGLYRSEDGGDTWARLTTLVSPLMQNQGRMEIAIAPSNNDVIYVGMSDNGATGNAFGSLVNVFRSTDGGDTWQARLDAPDPSNINPWLHSNLVYGNGCFGTGSYAQGWYDNVIAVDPMDSDVVWVGGIDLFRSDDGGQTFGIASYWWLGGYDPFVHADQHAIVFHPDYDGVTNQTMLVGCDGGVYRTQNARAATSFNGCPQFVSDLSFLLFEPVNNGYGVTQFYHGDAATGVDRFAGGAQDNGTSVVSAVGAIDSWASIFGGDGGYTLIDKSNADVIYAETQNFPNIIKSTNGGANFYAAVSGITDSDGAFITPIAMDPSNSQVLWTGGSRPWRTTNGASSWTLAGPADPFPAGATISAISVSPIDGNTVWIGFSNGVVARSTNALSGSPTWTEFDGSNGLPGAYVSSVEADPHDASVAYATFSTFGVPHVLRTANGGTTWTALGSIAEIGIPDVPVHSIAVHPTDDATLYAGTEIGVFVSEDTGATWAPANTGLARTVVERVFFRDASTVVAFTHGRGAFLAEVAVAPACAGDLNGDNATNAADFTILAGHFGSAVAPNTGGDLNGDGVVNAADFTILAGDFGCGS